MNAQPCPVCESPAFVTGDEAKNVAAVRCCRCGDFSITASAKLAVEAWTASSRFENVSLLSGWLREHWGSTVKERDLDRILDARMPSVGEKADRVLLQFAIAFPQPGALIEHLPELRPVAAILVGTKVPDEYLVRGCASEPALIAAGYCRDLSELMFLIQDCLTSKWHFLEIEGGHAWPSKITPAGWARIHELQQSRGSGSDGFIAMWFDASMDAAADAIHRAIRAAGYNPVRLDRVEYNNQIDDEIIARIRGSRFLVADLTGHRGGVYFEAGFALGLGLPVVWLCRENDLDNVHFDNRQYNFIPWQPGEWAELERRLKNRIEATIGHGPVNETGASG